MKMETTTYYSNGKLLITGEYLVLDGANAFALPTQLGQSLIISEGQNQEVQWTSYDSDGSIWFEDRISFFEIVNYAITDIETVKTTLIRILYQAYLVNPTFIQQNKGYNIQTKLTFAREWGLGTSSTLINNIAQWLKIDAFELLNTSFGGSGYDVACAQYNSPITYRLKNGKPIIQQIVFQPSFTNHIFFVYLNKKQSSKTAITNYKINKNKGLSTNIQNVNQLTEEVIQSSTIAQFSKALVTHESQMSLILETTTVKELLFNDFNGSIKSLGAWGGDFIMVTSTENPTAYFVEKGYTIIFEYDDLILS
ncbi:GYDIA family GHMP kinase [Flavobacterium sp. 7A]|uniref:GYDIA family GHMP kinase n=1 Tax=Flavobacterium sp. 7A TaxID=2940571 RepID=UPI0029CABD67|nr:GYDIA family GHMP kinase [Flavobacterium sp. 7A]